jgi:hypothetical protein
MNLAIRVQLLHLFDHTFNSLGIVADIKVNIRDYSLFLFGKDRTKIHIRNFL